MASPPERYAKTFYVALIVVTSLADFFMVHFLPHGHDVLYGAFAGFCGFLIAKSFANYQRRTAK